MQILLRLFKINSKTLSAPITTLKITLNFIKIYSFYLNKGSVRKLYDDLVKCACYMSIQNHYKVHALVFYKIPNIEVKFRVLIMIFTIYLSIPPGESVIRIRGDKNLYYERAGKL